MLGWRNAQLGRVEDGVQSAVGRPVRKPADHPERLFMPVAVLSLYLLCLSSAGHVRQLFDRGQYHIWTWDQTHH
jgi:hypothetical protein